MCDWFKYKVSVALKPRWEKWGESALILHENSHGTSELRFHLSSYYVQRGGSYLHWLYSITSYALGCSKPTNSCEPLFILLFCLVVFAACSKMPVEDEVFPESWNYLKQKDCTGYICLQLKFGLYVIGIWKVRSFLSISRMSSSP